ncbi:MAG: redoxin domain-containing protein [Acidobacteria bacterium]|nr:redoxin domain-containing protein [Acidobacteriota bacterium]
MLSPTEKQNVQILGISLDTHEESRVMAEEIAKHPGQLDFPLLTDVEHRVVDTYGLSNPAEFKAGIPYPCVYVIGKDGVVIDRFLDESGVRATNEQVRAMLKAAGAVS